MSAGEGWNVDQRPPSEPQGSGATPALLRTLQQTPGPSSQLHFPHEQGREVLEGLHSTVFCREP